MKEICALEMCEESMNQAMVIIKCTEIWEKFDE